MKRWRPVELSLCVQGELLLQSMLAGKHRVKITQGLCKIVCLASELLSASWYHDMLRKANFSPLEAL